MSDNVIQFRDYQKPVPQSESLLAQATGLVGFINGLTMRDPVEFNAALPVWPYTETNSYTAPESDSA